MLAKQRSDALAACWRKAAEFDGPYLEQRCNTYIHPAILRVCSKNYIIIFLAIQNCVAKLSQ